jgi:hypothetical protein
LLTPLLSAGFSLFSFDFGGAGHSTAEYITFGFNERGDLEDVLGLLNQILMTPYSHPSTAQVVHPSNAQIVLWGRSLVSTCTYDSFLPFTTVFPLVACKLPFPLPFTTSHFSRTGCGIDSASPS